MLSSPQDVTQTVLASQLSPIMLQVYADIHMMDVLVPQSVICLQGTGGLREHGSRPQHTSPSRSTVIRDVYGRIR